MKLLLSIALVVCCLGGFGQVEIDTSLIATKNWIQTNNEQTAVHKSYQDTSLLTIHKNRRWGNQLVGDKQILVFGDWKIVDGKLVFYDPMTHGFGYQYEITELTQTSLVIETVDMDGKKQTIRLK